MRPRSAALTILLVGAAAGPAARAQSCPEPSDLESRPGAEPLRVARSGPAELRLSWEDVLADRHVVYGGSLGALAGGGGYDHAVVAEADGTNHALPLDAGNAYYLVSAACGAAESSAGRDSAGGERPRGGTALVTVSVSGGSGVFGVGAELAHPAFSTAIEPEDVEFLGPYAEGAAGEPLSLAGLVPPDRVSAGATFTLFSPDPSFSPPVGLPLELFRFRFRTIGLPPAAADFWLVECTAHDDFGVPIAATSCSISSVLLE